MVSAAHSGSRRLFGALLVLACCFGVLGAAGAPPASAANQTAAVQAHLLWNRYDASDRERQLDRIKEAGVEMVRVDLGWATLEPEGKGHWDEHHLDKVDHVLRAAEQRDIEVLFTFWETPCWASSAPADLKQGCKGAWWDRGVQHYPAVDASDYGEALAFMIRRYGDRVAAWELWNEPNHPWFFHAPNRVDAYAALVKAAYPRAKAADPDSTIIAGSLADADFAFTEALLDRGVAGNFDAWSVHPYSEDRSPLHPGISGWMKKSFARGVPAVRKALLRHGQKQPMWLTEFGWSTCSVRGGAAWENCVSPSEQATYLRQAFGQMQNWNYVRVGVAFNLEATSGDASDRVDNYGLLNPDGSPKPAFNALAGAARSLGSDTRIRLPSKKLTLSFFRRGQTAWVTGRLPVGRTVRVKLHRWKTSVPRFSRDVSYNQLIRVDSDGRFSHRIDLAAAGSGKWRAVAKGRRLPRLVASAVLR